MHETYPWHHIHWEFITKNLQQQRLGHAFLLKGPKGLGKLEFALSVSKNLLCIKPQEGNRILAKPAWDREEQGNSEHRSTLYTPLQEDPSTESTLLSPAKVEFYKKSTECCKCQSCHLMTIFNHPDVRIIKPAKKHITLDQIREIIDFQSYTSTQNYKIIIVLGADILNIAAANALLKILEEPSPHTLFFLIAEKLPAPTIYSRCQVLSFTHPPIDIALKWLEQKGVDKHFAQKALYSQAYSIVNILKIYKEGHFLYKKDFLIQLEKIQKKDLEPIEATPPVIELAIDHWIYWIADLIRLEFGKQLFYLDQEEVEHLYRLKQNLDISDLFLFLDKLYTAKKALEQNAFLNSQLLWLDLCYYWSKLGKNCV